MLLFSFRRSIAALATGLILTTTASAQDTPDATQVIATVNGVDITLGHVITFRSTLPAQYDQLPAQVLMDGVLNQLIQQTVLMQSVDGELSKRTQITLENETRSIISATVLEDIFSRSPEEEAVLALYDERYATEGGQPEYRASHILVEDEEKAKALVQELQDGADFAILAGKHSTGPSGPNGGDLGWFVEGLMVEPFFNAVETLTTGEISEPVQTQFGWHVIKLDETRTKTPPTLDDVRDDIISEIVQKQYDAHVAQLEQAANIERSNVDTIDPELINNFNLLEN